MKRIIALLLVMVFLLTGCSSGEIKANGENTSVSNDETIDTSTPNAAPQQGDEAETNVIRFATINSYSFMPFVKQLEDFSEKHPEYEVVIDSAFTDKDQNLPDDEYRTRTEAFITRITTEIMSGNGPDVIDINSFETSKLIKSGMMEDIYSFMDNDPDVNKDDLFQNITESLEIDGKLYVMPTRFTIDAVSVNKEILKGLNIDLGGKKNITISELIDIYLKAYDSGVIAADEETDFFFGDTGRRLLVNYSLYDYLDLNNGKLDIDNKDFISTLEKIKRVKTNRPIGKDFNTGTDLKTFDDFLSGKGDPALGSKTTFFLWGTVGAENFTDLSYESETVTPYIPLGPSDDSSFFVSPMISIIKGTKNPEGAWQVLKYYAETQDEYTYGFEDIKDRYSGEFPINSKAFEPYIKAIMESDSYFNKIKDAGEEIIDTARESVKTANAYRWGSYGIDFDEILSEYLDKDLITAEECAKKMQSKAEIYLKE